MYLLQKGNDNKVDYMNHELTSKSVIQVRECILMGRICLQYTNALN